MVITRRKRREIDHENSHCLRSGNLHSKTNLIQSSDRRRSHKRQKAACGSPLPLYPASPEHIPQVATSPCAATTTITSESTFPDPQRPEDVGIPGDEEWDVNTVHEYRLCREHGEERLVEFDMRWMCPSDFNVNEAEALLEAKLQEFEAAKSELEPHNPACRAECSDSLWSQVDTPVQRGKFGDKVVYLIRWKLCWILERNIECRRR